MEIHIYFCLFLNSKKYLGISICPSVCCDFRGHNNFRVCRSNPHDECIWGIGNRCSDVIKRDEWRGVGQIMRECRPFQLFSIKKRVYWPEYEIFSE